MKTEIGFGENVIMQWRLLKRMSFITTSQELWRPNVKEVW